MGGGLMQLVAYGAQDIYLTGNPQITFFKLIYKRHCAFALEAIEQTFNGAADWAKKVTCSISRNGDLVHKMYVRFELPSITVAPGTAFRWCNWIGHALIKMVDFEIGGQRIDRHEGAWLHVWNELTQSPGKSLGYANMVGNTPELTNLVVNTSTTDSITVPGRTLYVPLQFYFCQHPGLSLPLIALQYHEVKVSLELAAASDLFWAGTVTTDAGTGDPIYTYNQKAVSIPSLPSCSLFVDYVYSDTAERKRMAQVSHEYLINQVQTLEESATTSNPRAKLVFNHPCRELIFTVQRESIAYDQAGANFGKQPFNFTDEPEIVDDSNVMRSVQTTGGGFTSVSNSVTGQGENPVTEAKLTLNGHDRFQARDSMFFNLIQPYQHHENIPSRGINVYSFALKPEEAQPSGTCNMSRIDTTMLNMTLTPKTTMNDIARIKVYAVNFNVLRILSGMAGLTRTLLQNLAMIYMTIATATLPQLAEMVAVENA